MSGITKQPNVFITVKFLKNDISTYCICHLNFSETGICGKAAILFTVLRYAIYGITSYRKYEMTVHSCSTDSLSEKPRST